MLEQEQNDEIRIHQYLREKQRLEYVKTYADMNYEVAEIQERLRSAGHICSEDEICFYIDYLKMYEGLNIWEITDKLYLLLWEEAPPRMPQEEKIEPIEPIYRPVQEFASRSLFLYLLTCRMDMMYEMWQACPERFKQPGWEREWVEVGFDSEYVRVMYEIISDPKNEYRPPSELAMKAYRILYVCKKKIYNTQNGTGRMWCCDELDLKIIQMECKTWCEEKVKQWLADIKKEENRKMEETEQ